MSNAVGYLVALAFVLFGVLELFFGLKQGRTFYTYVFQPRWAYRQHDPALFSILIFLGGASALLGASIVAVVVPEPRCWSYPGAIWLCPFDRSWS